MVSEVVSTYGLRHPNPGLHMGDTITKWRRAYLAATCCLHVTKASFTKARQVYCGISHPG